MAFLGGMTYDPRVCGIGQVARRSGRMCYDRKRLAKLVAA
jgi:hypothetical protein